jgi:hypothetical protein
MPRTIIALIAKAARPSSGHQVLISSAVTGLAASVPVLPETVFWVYFCFKHWAYNATVMLPAHDYRKEITY